MTTSKPHWHIAQSNLRIAPYVACSAVVALVILPFFIPFYPAFIIVAVAFAALTFAIHWTGVRLRTHLGFVGTFLTIMAMLVARERLLPGGMSGTGKALAGAQFLAAWMLAFSVLHILFRAKFAERFV